MRAAVIGSGFGGLAAAIRLQAKGIPTTIFEKRDKPGGRAYVYKEKGYTFDAGPTVITAPDAIRELFDLAGRSMDDYVKLVPVTPFYRLMWEDGSFFDYSNDEAKLLDQIRAFNPEDVNGYQRFFEYSKAVFHEGYDQLVHVPFLKLWDMVKVSPQLIRLEAYRSVYSMVSRYVKHPKLREAFSFHSLLVGGNPFSASSIYTLIHYLERQWGVYFAEGGTNALVNGLVKLFEDLDGEIRLSEEIDQIATDGSHVTGVRLKNGALEPFDLAVSNGDVVHTYSHLLSETASVRSKARRLERSKYSMSLFLIYFGVKKQYPDFAHHTVIFGPRYKELLDDIFKRGILADDFSLYIHKPTKTDPTMAPPGCESFYALSPVPHLGVSDIDWKAEGPRYADRILRYLDRHFLPGLVENLDTRRIFTPLDFQSELNSHWGSAFSLEPLLTQSAYFRAKNRDSKVGGLYLVGAGTHPGAGIPGVINSAKATVGVILSDLAANRERRPAWKLSPA